MIIRESRWPASLAGNLLIADIDLIDPHFHKTIVMIIEHSPKGAFGLVLNRPAPLDLNVLNNGTPVLPPEVRLHSGGPVRETGLTCLNSGLPREYQSANAQAPIPGLVFEPSIEHVFQYFQDFPDEKGSKIRFYVGYSGWGPGQLEYEMEQGAWAFLPGKLSYVFADPSQDVWLRAMQNRGGLYQIFAETGFKPSLN